jgi:hypothetical protein
MCRRQGLGQDCEEKIMGGRALPLFVEDTLYYDAGACKSILNEERLNVKSRMGTHLTQKLPGSHRGNLVDSTKD